MNDKNIFGEDIKAEIGGIRIEDDAKNSDQKTKGKNNGEIGSPTLEKVINSSILAAFFCLLQTLVVALAAGFYDFGRAPLFLIFSIMYIVIAIALEVLCIKNALKGEIAPSIKKMHDYKTTSVVVSITVLILYIPCSIFSLNGASAYSSGLSGLGPGLISLFGIFVVAPALFIITTAIDLSSLKTITSLMLSSNKEKAKERENADKK